jgi:aminoglycoside phosphotransferase (APT) family kinase protein
VDSASPTGRDARPTAFGRAEAALLADALDVTSAQITARTREPLGSGSVTGFDVATDDGQLKYYVDTSRSPVVAETGLATGDPSAPDARVWLHPADPHLPALPAAAFGHAAHALLGRLGLHAMTSPAFVAYRPGRRAVLRISTDSAPVWIKVVRPSRVEGIVERHARLKSAGVPVPCVLGWAPEGLIVLENARGAAAPDVAWEPERLLDAVDRVRASLAGVPLERAAPGAMNRLPWYAAQLDAQDAAPVARRAASLVARLTSASHAVARDEVTVHGDLHFGQLFLDDEGAVAGVIDVDTAGRGDPAEDSAAFIAHAVASALLTSSPEGRQRVWRLADAAHARWTNPTATARTAVHLIGHAIGALHRGEEAMGGSLVSVGEVIMSGGIPSSARDKNGLMEVFETA